MIRGRALAAALSGVVLALGAPLGAVHPADAAVHAQNNDQSAVIVVTAMTQGSLDIGQTFTIAGTVRNSSTDTMQNLKIELRASQQPLGSRSDLQNAASGTGRPPGSTITDWSATLPLAPGSQATWQINVATDQLGFGAPGVYPIGLEAIADDTVNGGTARVGAVRTFLAWQVRNVDPTLVSVVMPLIGDIEPTYGASGVKDLTQQLSPQGRLGVTLASGGSVSGLTWMVDPDTLEQINELSRAPAAGRSTPATRAASAEASVWLGRLRASIARGGVLAVPYGDPDLVASIRSGAQANLVYAKQLGAVVTQQVLGSTAQDSIAWPADGTANGDTLNALGPPQTAAVILSDKYTATSSQLAYTPSAIGPVDGARAPGIVYDSQLSDLFTAVPGPEGQVVARQRVLAEIAMITEERPFDQRSVVIVPPRRWTPTSGYTATLLEAIAAAPWANLTTVPSLLAAYKGQGTGHQQPGYPADVSNSEVAQSQYAVVRSASAELHAFENILQLPTNEQYQPVISMQEALLRAQSTYWRNKRAQGLRYVTSVKSAIEKLQSGVHIVNSGSLTLTAHSGLLPVTIVNETNVPVQVHVVLTAEPVVRLKLSQRPLLPVAPGGQATIEVPAQATTDGLVTVVARLYSPDGHAYGQAVTFPVQVSGYGTVAQIVVGFALGLLAVAVVARVIGAMRRGRRPGSTASVRELVR